MEDEGPFWGEAVSEPITGGEGAGAGDNWLVLIECPRCGPQETVWVTPYGAPKPRPEMAYPPLCPRCHYLDEPRGRVVSIERLADELQT
jgi:hypothetical protein